MSDSRAHLKTASADVRSDIGYQLNLVQRGEMPEDFRPMPDIGPGAVEIRIHSETGYRVFCVARFEEAVYVLHCFVKKTQATRKADLDIGRKRYSALIEARKPK